MISAERKVLQDIAEILGVKTFLSRVPILGTGADTGFITEHKGFEISGGRIVSLDLSNLGLSTLPENFGSLEKLKWLFLDDNKLTTLPESISNLQELRGLYIKGNHLSSLPSGICALENLRELDLSENSLSEIPSEIEKLQQLSELHLSSNKLKSLPVELSQLPNLFILDLRSNWDLGKEKCGLWEREKVKEILNK